MGREVGRNREERKGGKKKGGKEERGERREGEYRLNAFIYAPSRPLTKINTNSNKYKRRFAGPLSLYVLTYLPIYLPTYLAVSLLYLK